MIKLIVTDIDGTLVPDGVSSISPRYFEVIRELQKYGVIFGVASGRQKRSIERLFEPVKNDIVYIAENGAFAVYQGKELLHEPMTKEDSVNIVLDTRKIPGAMDLYDTRNMSYYEKGGEEVCTLMGEKYHYDTKMVEDLTQLEEPCLKYSVYRRTKVEEMTSGAFIPKWEKSHSVACGGRQFMDVVKGGINKGTALRTVQKLYKITENETAAIGDNINDLEMLEQAYFSFAIGNARKEVKEAAHFRTADNRHEGVLLVLEKVLQQWREQKISDQQELVLDFLNL